MAPSSCRTDGVRFSLLADSHSERQREGPRRGGSTGKGSCVMAYDLRGRPRAAYPRVARKEAHKRSARDACSRCGFWELQEVKFKNASAWVTDHGGHKKACAVLRQP